MAADGVSAADGVGAADAQPSNVKEPPAAGHVAVAVPVNPVAHTTWHSSCVTIAISFFLSDVTGAIAPPSAVLGSQEVVSYPVVSDGSVHPHEGGVIPALPLAHQFRLPAGSPQEAPAQPAWHVKHGT